MASPFSVFRRNQRVMMAVVTVASMFAFVILGPLMQYAGRNAERADSVVVETRYGSLHESELANLRQTRKIVEEFVKRLVEAAVMGLIDKKVVDPRQINMEMEINQALLFTVRSQPGEEEAAVETFVLARRAEQLGIVISDMTINEFLKRISFDTLPSDKIAQIIGQLKLQGGMSMSQGRLFDALRNELLAAEFSQMFKVGLAATPPGQRWDYFERVNRRASVELLPLPVANYVSEVPDPQDAELRKFFDEHKDQLQQPGSPVPGFKQPKKATFQYFKADFDKFVERAEAQVTDEQIRDFYEKNKDTRFRKVELPPESDTPAAKPKTPDGADAPAAGKDNPAAGKDSVTPDKDSAAPTKDTPPPGDDSKSPPAADGQPAKPVADKPGSAPAAPASPAPDAKPSVPDAKPSVPGAKPSVPDAKPAVPDSSPETPATPKEDAPDKDSKSAAARVDGPVVQLIGFPQTLLAQADPSAANPPAENPPTATPAAPAATSPPTDKPAAEAAAPATPAAAPTAAATEKPATEASTTEKPSTEKPATETATSEKPADEPAKTAASAAPVAYEPLDKVKDVIRKDLARTEARRQITKALEELDAAMRQYADDLVLYESQGDSQTKDAAPAPLDFAALAKQHGVTAHETDLISATEARDDTDIGRSYIQVPGGRSRFGLVFFDEVAFDDTLLKYKPLTSEDTNSNYLFWKTKSVEEQIPDFDDKIRSQVLRAWKLIAARKIAHEKAEKYLTEAKRDKATLEETFGKQPELKVLKPPMFSWMTMGNVPRDPSMATRPRLSEVLGADQPGDQFMKSVFDLSPGGFAVTMNHPETVVYVVHLLSFDRALDALFEQFGREPFQMYNAVGFDDMQKAYRGWIGNVMTEAKVHWEREPAAERNRS